MEILLESFSGRSRCLKECLQSCVLCPRRCRVNRRAGERGFCGLLDRVVVSHALPHHGEEPPISGSRGAGTIFFSSCNLGCSYCQNYQISHTLRGRTLAAEDLSGIMIRLWNEGCHNIEAVTPTSHVSGLVDALLTARDQGVDIPLVYNCGGYENPAVLRCLTGMVDIYLPDFKYGRMEDSRDLAGVGDYPHWALESLREMVVQVGDSLETEDGLALRGIIVRHLVLPGRRENSLEVLRLIKKHISTAIPLSLMSQYTPMPFMKDHPDLGRRVTAGEYEDIVNEALGLGFEEIHTQTVDDQVLNPDFSREEDPFQWA